MSDLNLSSLLGLTEDEAVAKIKAAGMKARIRSRDGEPYRMTMDARRDRVNLTVTDDKVTKADIG